MAAVEPLVDLVESHSFFETPLEVAAMHYLVATTSVHTTAAICDYLDERATVEDTVTVVAVVSPADESGIERRDAQEALNVATVRLAAVGEVNTELRETGDQPGAVLREAATAVGADEVLLTPHDGDPNASGGLGSTARDLLVESPVPAVVVPVPER